ncbi:MAG: hypothetical protein RLZZ595_26 [Bacteroidota bacterium]|jgi:FkbM family methyltransferase
MRFTSLSKNELLYKIAKKILWYSDHFLKKPKKLVAIGQQKKWDSLFKEYPYFIHDLSDGIKIKLYEESVLSQYIYYGYEIEERAYVSSVLKEGDYFVDVGANTGLYSLIASELVGQTGRVISFEPTLDTYNQFLENIDINRLTNIDSFNIGLSDLPGQLELYISNKGFDAWNSFAITINGNSNQKKLVDVSSLDLVLSNYDKSKIKLIKIDAEGWEKYILKGGIDLFTEYSPEIMVEFTEENTLAAGYAVQEIYDLMVDMGYQWYKIENQRLVKSEKKLNYPYENLIAKK